MSSRSRDTRASTAGEPLASARAASSRSGRGEASRARGARSRGCTPPGLPELGRERAQRGRGGGIPVGHGTRRAAARRPCPRTPALQGCSTGPRLGGPAGPTEPSRCARPRRAVPPRHPRRHPGCRGWEVAAHASRPAHGRRNIGLHAGIAAARVPRGSSQGVEVTAEQQPVALPVAENVADAGRVGAERRGRWCRPGRGRPRTH